MSRQLSGARSVADRLFAGGLLLFLVAGLVQIFLAGMGIFGINGEDLADATSFDPHRTLGLAMGGLALVLVVLALVARAGARTVVVTLVVALLANVVQSVLATWGEDSPILGGLHALDGLAILGLASFLFGEARERAAPSAIGTPVRTTVDDA